MDKAEHLVLVQPTLLFKDLGEHSWVHWGGSDIDATLCQVCLVEDQVAFLQLVKSQFSQRNNDLLALWTPVWICFSSPMILPVPLYGLNPQEVDVHLSHSVGHLFSSLGCCEEVLHNCSRDPTEDWDVTHDVEASWFLDMGDDFPGQRLITEFLHEVFLLLWVGEASHLCHHANTLSRDLIGCRRACGYPDAGGGKQVTPDEVCQQHVHRGRRCDISPDLVVLEVQRKSTLIQTIQDEDNLEPVVSADSCLLGFNKEVMKKFNQAELFPFSKFSSLKVKGNVKCMSWLALPSAQSRVNLCVKMVLPMPATPVVIIVLIGWSCPGKGLKMSSHLIGVSSLAVFLEAVSISLTSCSLLTSPLFLPVM